MYGSKEPGTRRRAMRGNFIPREYDIFAGLDVSKKSISVTFTNHQGFIRSLNMPHKAEHLLNYVRKHFPDQKIAFVYEAGPTGYGLYDGLAAQAYPCLIAAPSMIPRAPGQRVKTNRLDSKALSENLRGGQLKSIHVPSPIYRQLRHLTQLRDVLVSELAGMKQRIKSLLLFEGIEFPPAPPGSQWSFLVKDKLRKLPCSGTVRFKLDQLLDSLEFNEKQVLKTITEIRRFCRSDPELSQCMKYLMPQIVRPASEGCHFNACQQRRSFGRKSFGIGRIACFRKTHAAITSAPARHKHC